MPKREYREKHYKKTKYSSDSSDDDYRKSRSKSSSYRDKHKSRKGSEKLEKYQSSRKRDDSSSSSYSRDSRSSRSSSSSSSEDSRSRSKNNRSNRPSSTQKEKSTSVQRESEQVKKFELDDLYNEKDKTKILEEIESDSFKQSTFKQTSKIIVDLDKDKIMVPTTSSTIQDDSLIHPNFLGDNEKRVDKWIKKLYMYRNQ